MFEAPLTADPSSCPDRREAASNREIAQSTTAQLRLVQHNYPTNLGYDSGQGHHPKMSPADETVPTGNVRCADRSRPAPGPVFCVGDPGRPR